MEDLLKTIAMLRERSSERYKKLSERDKGFCTSIQPRVLSLALRHKKVTDSDFKDSLEFAQKNLKKYFVFLSKRGNSEPVIQSESRAYKELTFQGFIEQDARMKRLQERGYHFVISKCPILGKKLYLPIKCGHDYDTLKRGYPDIYAINNAYGLPNWTRTDLFYKI